MRKMREFKCEECGCISAALVEDDIYEIVCRQENCDGEAKRVLSFSVAFGNTVGNKFIKK